MPSSDAALDAQVVLPLCARYAPARHSTAQSQPQPSTKGNSLRSRQSRWEGNRSLPTPQASRPTARQAAPHSREDRSTRPPGPGYVLPTSFLPCRDGRRAKPQPRPVTDRGATSRLRKWFSCDHRINAALPCGPKVLRAVGVDEKEGDAVRGNLPQVGLASSAALGFGLGDHLFGAFGHLRSSYLSRWAIPAALDDTFIYTLSVSVNAENEGAEITSPIHWMPIPQPPEQDQ